MKRGSTLLLKIVISLIGLLVMALLLWFPTIEGRNANADLFTIYFRDPFLAYVYLGSTPFFMALYQGIKLLGYIEQNKAFSSASVTALRNIKYCALIISGFIIVAIPSLLIFVEQDDAPGGVVIGIVILGTTIVTATAAAVFQKLFQNAVNIKSENDLTV